MKNANGVNLTQGLFLEKSYDDPSSCIYTLKDEDHPDGYKSLYQLYMHMEDLTEFEFSNKYLNGWKHWTQLCNCNWFKPYIERWRKELHLKLAARAIKNIVRIAGGNSREAYQANKYLLDKGFFQEDQGKKNISKAGRPTKEQIQNELTKQAKEAKDIDEDYKRLGFH